LAIATETPGYEADYLAEAEDTIDIAHLAAMLTAARDGSAAALAEGAQAEANWNTQITGSDLAQTAFFETEDPAEQIAVAIANYLVGMGITEVDGQPVQFRIVASSKNLRSGPEREYDRVGSIAHGTVVTALGRDEGGWIRVTDGEHTGWGTAIHLAPHDGSPAPNWADGTPGGGGNRGSVATTEVTPSTTRDDLFWLALAIELEAGSNWICDEHQLFVGNVVLNRVAHPRFAPTTIHGVVSQRGQYPWYARGVRGPISDRAWANAQRLLNGERFLPYNVVFQAQFFQGDGTYRFIAPHYFGYINS